MIKYIVMLILVSLIVNAATETIDLSIGDSFDLLDKNVTLMAVNDDEGKIIVCVNNQKVIIEDNDEKLVNGVYIEVERVNSGNARLKIERDCKNCECGENCNNELCIQPSKEEVFNDAGNINEDVNIETNEIQNDDTIIIKGSKDQQRNNLILGIGIVILIIIVLMFIMLKIKK